MHIYIYIYISYIYSDDGKGTTDDIVGTLPSNATATHTSSQVNEVAASGIVKDSGVGVAGTLNIVPITPVFDISRPGLRAAMHARFGKKALLDRKYLLPITSAYQSKYKCTNVNCSWKIAIGQNLFVDKKHSDLITPGDKCFLCCPQPIVSAVASMAPTTSATRRT